MTVNLFQVENDIVEGAGVKNEWFKYAILSLAK